MPLIWNLNVPWSSTPFTLTVQVLDHSRDFRELLNVLASLQNILDPDHFKGNAAAMKKVRVDGGSNLEDEEICIAGFYFCRQSELHHKLPGPDPPSAIVRLLSAWLHVGSRTPWSVSWPTLRPDMT